MELTTETQRHREDNRTGWEVLPLFDFLPSLCLYNYRLDFFVGDDFHVQRKTEEPPMPQITQIRDKDELNSV